jgi:hypothetical protein
LGCINRSHEGREQTKLPAILKLEIFSMSQTAAAPIRAALDFERTLVLSIEVSNKSWVLAAQVPGLPHTKAKRTVDADAESLMAAIAGYRARAAALGRSIERVIAVYDRRDR